MMQIPDREFDQFAEYIRTEYGIHFKNEKKGLIEGRLGQVLAALKLSSLSEYLRYVQADASGRAAAVMLDRITTNYTFFMREPEHFQYFSRAVLPYLAQTAADHDLRVWSAACSTGEEPYTLAMLMDEYFGPGKGAWNTQILATDIAPGVLAAARAGVYGNDKLADLPETWRRRYFTALSDGQSQVCERIRGQVAFGSLNLMSPSFPFKRRMHAIFCRNVMIYFDNPTKDRLVERLYDITEPGGFLFIGHSESLSRDKTRYRYVMPAVYRKE